MIRRSGILLASLAVLSLASPALATISYTPARPNIDQAVTFNISVGFGSVDPGSVLWRFGDGATASGQIMVQHVFGRIGTFTVQCHYYHAFSVASGVWVDEETALTVVEDRSVSAKPSNPQVNQAVAFTAVNFLSASIRWSFGDGTPAVMGGAAINHAFTRPGIFVVAARDKGGAGLVDITATVSVAVDISRRSIAFAPAMPVARQPVTFTAVNFYTTDIRWDFGDGTPAVSGGPTSTHAFVATGLYTVQAWDWNGLGGGPTSITIRVEQPTGPTAPFQIFFLQLRFEDGLSYKVVPRGFAGLTAFADIKYEGTGLFQAQWLVDGMPFQTASQALPFAEATTLNSGRIPALPTSMTGMHEVSLRILSPASTLTMPIIRYFVSAETGTPPLRGLNLQVATVEGLKGVASELRLDSLRIPAGTYFILNGSVTYAQAAPIRYGLLRIHLGDDLADQQILRDLKPAETRGFTTSIFNPTPEGKFIYITLYDISDPNAPKLLYLKKIAILPND
ncbi:MAG: PKD domain-containing protein [Candidatus Aminicenantes bacterium]|nr:PKD domain-containing protein [Candidatus Aminicenantes bacterium]